MSVLSDYFALLAAFCLSNSYSLPTLLDFLTSKTASSICLSGFVPKAAVKNTLSNVIKKDSFFELEGVVHCS